MREEFLTAISQLSGLLQDYIKIKLKGNSQNARLGFSSEKELFNICAKLFSNALTIRQRNYLSYLWQTIQNYRKV
jgi:hypothetical protein